MSLSYLIKDIQACSKSRVIAINLKWFLFSPTLHMIFFIRLGQSMIKTPFIGKLFSFFIGYIIRIFYSSDISLKSQLGAGLVIMHGHDIVIGADVVIGDNCKIFNGVTLGNRDTELSSKGNQPRVGNNVLISTGVKILGAVVIGDNVQIGANSVVLKNCEEGCTYVGVPAKKANS